MVLEAISLTFPASPLEAWGAAQQIVFYIVIFLTGFRKWTEEMRISRESSWNVWLTELEDSRYYFCMVIKKYHAKGISVFFYFFFKRIKNRSIILDELLDTIIRPI